MINTYYLQRIVKTNDPSLYRYIWDDLHERTQSSTWTGFFRGCEGSQFTERYSHPGEDVEFPYNPWAVEEPVIDLWTRNNLPLEEVDPEWLAAQQAKDEEEE